MARRDNSPPPPPPERSRVRFMFVEVDGTSDDIKTLAQTFAHVVRAPQQPAIAPRTPPIALNGAAAPAPPTPPAQPTLFDDVDPNAPETEPDAAPAPAAASPSPAPAAPPKTTNGAKKKFKQLTVLELDLTTGAKPFKTYVDEQAPDEHSKRYLVIAQWLKEHRGIAEVSADHIYTCYRSLSLAAPDDVLLVFRALKKQGWVDNGSKRGLYKINHIGEGKLLQPKAKG